MKYGRYISANRSSLMVRVPEFRQENFKKAEFSTAMVRRDELCALVGRAANDRPYQAGRKHIRPHIDKTNNLPVGISYCKRTVTLADGGGAIYITVIAQGKSGTIPKNKSWSVNKYGESQAIENAIRWRNR